MAKNKNKHVLTPSDIFGGQKRPLLTRKQWIKFIGVFSFVLVLVNSYFLFKPDSKVDRIYHLNEYEWQVKKNYKQFLSKQSVVASKEVINITADATDLDHVKVKKGQIIYENEPLAVYNEATRQQLVREKEVELEAYDTELDGLNDALKEVERQAENRPSNSYVNADQIAENVRVDIQMEIVQNNTSSEASAILMQHIAELERKIEIARATLNDLNETKSITSPINGSIGDILYADGSVTFEIHSSEKNIIAYLSEAQWREVSIGQSVTVEVEGHDEPVVGVVAETQEYPAHQSGWLQRLIQVGAIKEDEPVYEIRIDVNDLLLLAPFQSLAEAEITIQEANNSFIAPSQWIVHKEIEGVSNEHIYTVDYAGKIRLEPITVLHEASANRWTINEDAHGMDNAEEDAQSDDEANEDAQLDDETSDDETSEDVQPGDEASDDETSEDAHPGDEASEDADGEAGDDAVAKRQLKHVKSRVDSSEDESLKITAFTMNTDGPSVLLNSKEKRIQAASFLPLPLQTISFDEIRKITWKDVVKYLFY